MELITAVITVIGSLTEGEAAKAPPPPPRPAFVETLSPEAQAVLGVACANLRAVGESHEACK